MRSKPNTVISKFAAAIALLMAITFFTTAQAQITTAIRGVVVNQQDEAVTDASVKITHTASGTVSIATSNENGVFSARGLRVGGPYSVEISGSGFSAVQIDDLYLALDRTLNLPVTIQAEAAIEEVRVIATRQSVGYKNQGLGTDLGIEALEEVASIDRDITDAAAQNPFAIINVQSGGAKELTIAGANNRFNSLTVDGVALNDRFGLNANGYPTQR